MILDPACGTGRICNFAEQLIVGMDFNPELVKASKMNMVMKQ